MNHTDAVSTAARGLGVAYGFCHIDPCPENCWLISLASASIDWARNHDTYAGLVPFAGPSWVTDRRSERRLDPGPEPQRAGACGMEVFGVGGLDQLGSLLVTELLQL